MDTKKVVVGVFLMLGTLLLVVIVWNVVFNNNLVDLILNKILGVFNKLFKTAANSNSNMVNDFNSTNVKGDNMEWSN